MIRSTNLSTLSAANSRSLSATAQLTQRAGIVLVGTALIAISAHLSVPLFFTPVPITLQPFAVLLLALLLSPRLALATTVAYLAEGAMGLPVFTPHGLGGVAQLLGPTGGYLLSYPVVAPLLATVWRAGNRTFARAFALTAIASFGTLAMGAIWLGLLTHAAPLTLMNHAVLPFLPGDALKVVAAASIGVGVTRLRKHSN